MQRFLNVMRTNFETVLSGFFLSVTVLVVILNVILRYAFRSGIFWVEEVATTCFIWSVFVGAASAYRNNLHIGIDVVTKLFPKAVQKFVSVAVNAAMVVINGYIVYLSILFIQSNRLKRTPVLDIPAIYVNLSITAGFGLITLYALYFLYKDIEAALGEKASF